jgi:hypothetical protein
LGILIIVYKSIGPCGLLAFQERERVIYLRPNRIYNIDNEDFSGFTGFSSFSGKNTYLYKIHYIYNTFKISGETGET